MMWPDATNGLFECLGGWFVVLNIWKLLKDKQVKGIHWGSTFFFTTWGLWNLWYYPHLGQWVSFAGGVFICTANIVWAVLRIYYNRWPPVVCRHCGALVPRKWAGL